MFPGFFTSLETLWNVVKRGEKESREYTIQAGRSHGDLSQREIHERIEEKKREAAQQHSL